MNLRLLALTGVLAGTLTASGAAIAPSIAAAQAPAHMRVDDRSDRNVASVRRRLERMIDQLQRDSHDYGGHRVKAIAALNTARAELDAALDYDAGHK